MVDEFLGAGFGYFDIRCVYRNGKSEETIEILRTEDKMNAIASWALRFALDPDGVLAVLSGMSERRCRLFLTAIISVSFGQKFQLRLR